MQICDYHLILVFKEIAMIYFEFKEITCSMFSFTHQLWCICVWLLAVDI
jgi:hypothetical protein